METLQTSINSNPEFPALFIKLSETKCMTICGVMPNNHFIMITYEDVEGVAKSKNVNSEITHDKWITLVNMVEFIAGKKADKDGLDEYADLLNKQYYKEEVSSE